MIFRFYSDALRPSAQRLVWARLVWGFVAFVALLPAAAFATWRDDVGYTTLESFLGDLTPQGRGVSFSLVEATSGGNPSSDPYFPVPTDYDPNVPQNPLSTYDTLFGSTTDADGVGVVFIDGSGLQSNGVSNHAAGQAKTILSNVEGQSIAPGVNAVTVYQADHFLGDVLNADSNAAPLALDFRVQNHSWIGSYGSTVAEEHAKNVTALRRFDYAIDMANGGEGLTAVVGVSNGPTMPWLLAPSYNAIAVGNSDGSHSVGLTLEDDPAISGNNSYGPGRAKPDIVSSPPPTAGASTTSTSTSAVSSIAILLHETASAPDARRAEVIKAQLMAGATKDEPEFAGWSRTTTQPLDVEVGAGEVNILNSFKIQQGGQHAGAASQPSTSVGSYGWDYGVIDAGGDLYYNFEVAEGSSATELSILATWFAEVDNFRTGLPNVANLDLAFYDSSETFLGAVLDESVSQVNNVEHIYQVDLDPGLYTLVLSGDASRSRDFALAWRMETLLDVPSADFNGDGLVTGIDLLTLQRNIGTLMGATFAEGDADGDGDVDADDQGIFFAAYGAGQTVAPPLLAAAVPEPTAATAALLGVLASLLIRRPSRPTGRQRLV